jgi:hypothetical protein
MSSFKMRDSRIGSGQKEALMKPSIHDQNVIAELEKLDENTTTPSQYLRQALALGATPSLLAVIADNHFVWFTPGETVTGLPYVHELRAAGWSDAQLAEFLENQCFTDENEQRTRHLMGFWEDNDLWTIFDADAFVRHMLALAATYHGCMEILTEIGHDALEAHLGPLRETTPEYKREVREIEKAAVRRLNMPESEYQVKKMLQYLATGRDDAQRERRLQVAAELSAHWGWSIVFRGYALAAMPTASYAFHAGIAELYQIVQDKSRDGAASVYRWLAEGFAYRDKLLWETSIDRVRSAFRNNGWHFARLVEVNGKLKATFKIDGKSIVVWHRPGDEPLTHGDPVMLHESDLEDKQPRIQPGPPAYEFTLTPALRPTPEQLANPKDQFSRRKK